VKRIMINIFALVVIVGFLNQQPAEASITLERDSFTGTNTLASDVGHAGPFDQVLFMKFFNKNGNPNGYLIGVTKFTSKEWWFFSKKQASVKIDEAIYNIPVTHTNSKYIKDNAPLVLRTNSSMNPDNIIDYINTARTVTFRIYFDNQLNVDWLVPQNVLDEWKKVINSDKDGKVNPEQQVINTEK
jgi:hypothetical protein